MQSISIGKNRVRVFIIALLAIAVILALFNTGAIRRQLDAWKLLPQPERLTELYYVDHAKLPTTYTPGVEQKFSFITHNLEYRDTAYRYIVTQQSEDGAQMQKLAEGTFSLMQDTIGTTPVTFTPTDMGKRSMIVTTLTNTTTRQQQSIHYWLTSTNQTTTEQGANV